MMAFHMHAGAADPTQTALEVFNSLIFNSLIFDSLIFDSLPGARLIGLERARNTAKSPPGQRGHRIGIEGATDSRGTHADFASSCGSGVADDEHSLPVRILEGHVMEVQRRALGIKSTGVTSNQR